MVNGGARCYVPTMPKGLARDIETFVRQELDLSHGASQAGEGGLFAHRRAEKVRLNVPFWRLGEAVARADWGGFLDTSAPRTGETSHSFLGVRPFFRVEIRTLAPGGPAEGCGDENARMKHHESPACRPAGMPADGPPGVPGAHWHLWGASGAEMSRRTPGGARPSGPSSASGAAVGLGQPSNGPDGVTPSPFAELAALAGFLGTAVDDADGVDNGQDVLGPFLSGAMGYVGFEAGQWLEVLTPTSEPPTQPANVSDFDTPEISLMWFDWVLVHSHATEETWISAVGRADNPVSARTRVDDRIVAARAWVMDAEAAILSSGRHQVEEAPIQSHVSSLGVQEPKGWPRGVEEKGPQLTAQKLIISRAGSARGTSSKRV